MKRLPLLILFLSLSSFAAQADENPSPAPYYVPPAQFNATLEVMDAGFANVTALFRAATAGFSFDANAKSLSNFRAAIDATSLTTANPANEHDLAGLLGSFQYPEIRVTAPDPVTFTDNKAELKATVSFHGVTKPVTFEAILNRVGKSSKAGGMWSSEGNAVGLSLKGTLKRADFGLSDPAPTGLDTPTPRFGDTLTLTLDMQALQQ